MEMSLLRRGGLGTKPLRQWGGLHGNEPTETRGSGNKATETVGRSPWK